MRRRSMLLTTLLIAAGCGPSAEEQAAEAEAARQQAIADTLAMAEATYEPAAFDSIQWVEQSEAIARGQVVFSYSCAKCHGRAGDGTGGFVQQGDTLRPPSFLIEDWRFRDDHEGLRRQIFVGTANGMPHWGLEGLTPRDMDAVGYFIRFSLRDGG